MAAKKKAATKAKAKAAPKKKAAAKKAAPKKKATAKKAAPAKAAPVKAIKEAMTKTQILNSLAESTGLSRKEVSAVLDGVGDLMAGHLKKRNGAGTFTMPGLFKVVTKHKPAQKARKGLHPITKEPTMFKAKPASVQVKVRPLKKMKDMAQ